MSVPTRPVLRRPPFARTGSMVLEVMVVIAMIPAAVFGVAWPLLGPAGLGVGTGPSFGAVPSVPVTLDTAAVTISTTPDLPTLGGDLIEKGQGLESPPRR